MTEPEYFEFNKNRTVENPNIIKAIVQVASVFHDDAYAHVDGGLTSEISDKLKSYIEPVDESNKKWKIKESTISNLPKHIEICLDIFGYKPNQELNPMSGQNEFISALLASDMLNEKGLPLKRIAQVATIIEATIPFIPNNKFAELEQRLSSVNEKFELGLTQEEIKETFRAAVFTANKDV